MTFSEIVKSKLELSKLSVLTLSLSTGYSAQYLYDLLKGRRRWNEDTINKVCNVLNIEVEYKIRKEAV